MPILIDLYRQLHSPSKRSASEVARHRIVLPRERDVHSSFRTAAVTFVAMTVFGSCYMVLALVMATREYTPANLSARAYEDGLLNVYLTGTVPGMFASSFALGRSVVQYRQHRRSKDSIGAHQGLGLGIRVHEEVVVSVELASRADRVQVELLQLKWDEAREVESGTSGASIERAGV